MQWSYYWLVNQSSYLRGYSLHYTTLQCLMLIGENKFIPIDSVNSYVIWKQVSKWKNYIWDCNFWFLLQHRGRIRAYGRRWGHVQGVPYSSQEPEDPGSWCGDHPSESRHQARDLVRSDHQLLDSCAPGCMSSEARGMESGGFGFNLRFYVFDVWSKGGRSVESKHGEVQPESQDRQSISLMKKRGWAFKCQGLGWKLSFECICLNVFLWRVGRGEAMT